MSDQLQTQVNSIQQQMNEVSIKVGKGETAHNNLKESLDETKGMIKSLDDKWETWRGGMESQVHAIAQAVLQDQAREQVEDALEEKQEQKGSQEDDHRLEKRIAILVVGVTLLTNIDKVLAFCQNLINLITP